MTMASWKTRLILVYVIGAFICNSQTLDNGCLSCSCEDSDTCDSPSNCDGEFCGSFKLTEKVKKDKCIQCRCVESTICETTSTCEGDMCGPFSVNFQDWMDPHKPSTPSAKKFGMEMLSDKCMFCTCEESEICEPGECNASMCGAFRIGADVVFNTTQGVVSLDPAESEDERFIREFFQEPAASAKDTLAELVPAEEFDDKCLYCLCNATDSCNRFECKDEACGPFMITEPYWEDARDTLRNETFMECAMDLECSKQTVKNYMSFYRKDCDGDGLIKCVDYAAMHRKGASMCFTISDEDSFVPKIKSCLEGKPLNEANEVDYDF